MGKPRVQECIDRAGQEATIDVLRTRPQENQNADKRALRMALANLIGTARRE